MGWRRARAQPRTFSSPQGLLAAKMRQFQFPKKTSPKQEHQARRRSAGVEPRARARRGAGTHPRFSCQISF